MTWQFFWQLIALMVVATVLTIILISALRPPGGKL